MAIKIKDADGNEHEVLTKDEQSDMVTGAVKSATKKLATDLTATLTESLGKSLGETLTAYETKREEAAAAAEAERVAAAAAGGGSKGAPAIDAANIENSPAFRSMQKKLDAALKSQEASEAKAKAEAAKAKDTSLRQRLTEEMDKNGFDPKRRHLAISHLVDGAKLARFAEDGETIVFRDTDGSDVDLPTGLKSFAQTDDGKTFMPPSGASGTGDRSRFTPPAQSKTGKVAPGTLAGFVLAAADGAPQSPIG